MTDARSDALATEDIVNELEFVTIDKPLITFAVMALNTAKRQGRKIITAESCTGGLIATVLSEAPGAADHFDGGFVTYTPTQKCRALGLDKRLIDAKGAVSAEVTIAMAEGALARSGADIAVAVTGVAGPDTDEKGNPLGLVFLARASSHADTICVEKNFGDIGRKRVRYEAAAEALRLFVSME
jgi:nicotinamide-nucleotide amidase